MRIRALACTLLCSLFISACDSDPIRPEDLAGLYSLVVSSESQQRELLSASESCDEWLVFGTLSLGEDATYSLVLEIELDCTRGGGSVTEEERTSDGTFTLAGRVLTLTADSGTLSTQEFTGVVDRGAIEIVVPDLAATGDLKLVFAQIFPQ